jgi:hypothetical protein
MFWSKVWGGVKLVSEWIWSLYPHSFLLGILWWLSVYSILGILSTLVSWCLGCGGGRSWFLTLFLSTSLTNLIIIPMIIAMLNDFVTIK